MAEKSKRSSKSFPVQVLLTDAPGDDRLDALQAHLFDRNGTLAASTKLKVSRKGDTLVAEGTIDAAAEQLQSARLVIAPQVPAEPDAPAPRREVLERQLGAYTAPLQLSLADPRITLRIPRPYWERWPRLCLCWIRGRLVKRVQLPGGSVLDVPICHARVTICEVDRWSILIERLPYRDLLRLRDELLEAVRIPIPFPEPDPEPFFSPVPGMGPGPLQALAVDLPAMPLAGPAFARSLASNGAAFEAAQLLRTGNAVALRAELVAHFELLRPYLCLLPWIEHLFVYTRQCFGPVETDEQGRFSYLYVHDCRDTDQPDIYISAEQFIGGSWTTIHAPPVRCHTIWNYTCGDEITVVVTDPRAIPCVPDIPTDPPPGVDRWVMPLAVGATFIRGTAAMGPSPAGWVRPDGLTDYGGYVGAPFGGVLGFRQQHALSIPNTGAGGQYFYRWSYRRGTSGGWTRMLDPVSRTYVRDLPGPAVQFPSVQLGPQPGELFRFKTAIFNPADWGVSTAGDPPGTSYYWPVDNSIGDIYAARWTSPGTASAATAPGLADSYQVKLEVFDSLGNPVAPGAATFQFVVPLSFDGTTLDTRVALPSELDGGGFVFTLVVDNSRCGAAIQPPELSTGVEVDDCGFLRYAPGSSLTLAFDATHPNQRATFGFGVVRGALPVAVASAGGEVAAPIAGSYTGDGAGHFSNAFAVATLLGPLPGHPGTCANAAFAGSLHVYAKATDGNSRISGYDAGALRAWALAQP